MANIKLNDADARVVDLLIEKTTADTSFAAAGGAVDQNRLDAVSNLFNLLSQIPEEPLPVDLLARTIKRLRTAASAANTGEAAPANLPVDRPGPAA